MIKLIKGIITLLVTGKVKEVIVVKEKIVVVEVLSQSGYERVLNAVEKPIVTNSDTAHSAAYKLGIQRTLAELRNRAVQG